MIREIITYTPMYITLFWAIVLFVSSKKSNRAKGFLSVFMSAAFLLYLSHAVYFNNYRETYLYFDCIYTLAAMLVYPLYYLYIKLLTINTRLERRSLLHIIPAVTLFLSISIVYALMDTEERNAYIQTFLFKESNSAQVTNLYKIQQLNFYISRMLFTTQIIFYLIKGIKLVKKYNIQIANFYSDLENKTIVWVNLILISFVITSFMGIIFNFLGKSRFIDSTLLLLIPSLIFSVLLFLIGLQGYMQNHSVADLLNDKFHNSNITAIPDNKERLKNALLSLFEDEKIYRRTDLKITHISTNLSTNRTYISNLINNDFSCSFNEFVNRYRIQEAKEFLSKSDLQNHSLEYVAEKVGFGSLHTFIRVFKSNEGITPGQFRTKYFR